MLLLSYEHITVEGLPVGLAQRGGRLVNQTIILKLSDKSLAYG
jgi:hypothetical protein